MACDQINSALNILRLCNRPLVLVVQLPTIVVVIVIVVGSYWPFLPGISLSVYLHTLVKLGLALVVIL